MVTTSGFAHTPISRFLILCSVASSIAVSILDIKYLVPIKITPHLWPYLQFYRFASFQGAYTSSTELLFSTALLYQFRILERLWGSRKYASFIVVCFTLNALIIPILCLILKFFTFGTYNYVPGGLIAVAFATLSVWIDEVPRLYRYKILTGTAQGTSQEPPGIVLSDKSTTYLLAAQLALSQFPYQIMPAAIGWLVGTAWGGDILPGRLSRWRVPAWVVGESSKGKEREQFEGLRRRLEEEGGSADGMRNVSDNAGASAAQQERRGYVRQFVGYFTGS